VHPEGRRAVFVGDLVDRGPGVVPVLRLVMEMVASGNAICVPGNHEAKLVRKLEGRDVQITHGLAESLAQLEPEPAEFREAVGSFLRGLVSHAVLDDGRLVVAHAGMPERYQGRGSRRVRDFALFGETTGETDELGLPVRGAWAADYRGAATVVYGHTPVAEPEWVNNTINIDTGCVFGGRLTALRWPERLLVSVPAAREHYAPARPFLTVEPVEERPRHLLDIDDVAGKRIVSTRLAHTVTVAEENAAGALEVMSRFAVDPRWLVYLPPTMAPTATSARADALEYPAEAFAEFRTEGVGRVVCEEKHMGSRAIAVVCRDEGVARSRFGVEAGSGALYTRTGRPFLDDCEPALARLRAAVDRAGLWDALDTGWLVLDRELLPWSAKAMELIRRQYAAVGAAGRAGLGATVSVLETASARGLDVGSLLAHTRDRAARIDRYGDAYRRYVWPVAGLDDLRVAPFHILAAESGAFAGRDHGWHLEHCDALVAADPEWIRRTDRRIVDVTDPASEAAATDWWESLTGSGGEGMVVKPFDFTARGRRGLVQPGVKVRGREYLRIIYGPEYDAPSQIDRLRSRGLGRKRSLASREFALGIEALERFVRREPLYRVHECVFAVLALESEPVARASDLVQFCNEAVLFRYRGWIEDRGVFGTSTVSCLSRHTPSLEAVAAAQKDLITHAQLVAAGLTRQAIAKRVASGTLHRRHRGVYSLGPAPLAREAQFLAAVLGAGPGSALSRASLAELHGLTRHHAPLSLSFLRDCAPSSAFESTATERSTHATSRPIAASRSRRSLVCSSISLTSSTLRSWRT
jgi:protein phosphatase